MSSTSRNMNQVAYIGAIAENVPYKVASIVSEVISLGPEPDINDVAHIRSQLERVQQVLDTALFTLKRMDPKTVFVDSNTLRGSVRSWRFIKLMRREFISMMSTLRQTLALLDRYGTGTSIQIRIANETHTQPSFAAQHTSSWRNWKAIKAKNGLKAVDSPSGKRILLTRGG